jgi:rRNA maturation endonuclease Nob1
LSSIEQKEKKTMNILKNLFSGNSSKKEIKEETTETKKCVRCLRRIKITFNACPHCRSMDFVYES